jgi:hypothetical protein
MTDECGSCRFWVRRTDKNAPWLSGMGDCRRFPPTEPQRTSYQYGWPLLKRESWCGEYQTTDNGKDTQT